MLRLPDVSLMTVTGVSIEDAAKALEISMRNVKFAAVKLLAPVRPATLPVGVEHVSIPRIDFNGYSRFMLNALHEHFDTTHCLIVQADGFVINAELWRQEFLAYDYVGAPWPEQVLVTPGNRWLRLDRNRVGNGGFSLRSHRLMKMAAEVDFDLLDFPLRSEDLVLCHYLYERLRQRGVTYAPLELAAKFSVEMPYLEYGHGLDTTFGFHGKHLLAAVLQRLSAIESAKGRGRLAQLNLSGALPPGRNEACPCGSGKRFKHCHGALA